MRRFLSSLPSISSLAFNDTPQNDFSSLSSTIDINWHTLSQKGGVQMFPLMIPKNYYHQILPDSFVDVGFCFTALHWLRYTPQDCDQQSESVRSVAAHNDLVTFLSARYSEIRKGGMLLLCIPAKGPLSVTSLLQCLEAATHELAKTHQIQSSVVNRLPVYFRSMEEILLAVESAKGQWHVAQKLEIPLEHPAARSDMEDRDHKFCEDESLEIYASEMTRFMMAALANVLMDDYVKQTRGRVGKDEVLEKVLFLDELATGFKREVLRSHCHEVVGFTYAFVRLEKL
jgi:hypothetical protein